MSTGLQLDINFNDNTSNRLRSALESGKFTVLVECSLPEEEIDQQGAAGNLNILEESVLACSNENLNTGLAITDYSSSSRRWRGAEYATFLSEGNRDRHAVYISGYNTSLKQAAELADIAVNAGFCNVVPVSGALPQPCTVKECRKLQFTESTAMLRLLQSEKKVFSGSVVNPFQYMAYPLLGEYFKAVKKLKLGSGFLVTQAGWDMLKIQSFAWFMMNRKLYYPMLTRLMILTPERVEDILEGKMPGVRISNDFRKILERELHYSKNQFEAAQYRRIELQAAGCRLMGFSGIQICGAENPARVRMILSRIEKALKEYTDFNIWLEEYNAYMASAEMAPFSNNFQLFDPILCRDYPLEDEVLSNDIGEPVCGKIENIRLKLKELMFSKSSSQRAGHLHLAKVLLAGCRGCSDCRLDKREYVCTENCPKRLADGPCGNVKPNGFCEHGNFECIHSKVVRFAHKRGTLPQLENQMVNQSFK